MGEQMCEALGYAYVRQAQKVRGKHDPNPNPSPNPNPDQVSAPADAADVHVYTSALSACSRAGRWKEATARLGRMEP